MATETVEDTHNNFSVSVEAENKLISAQQYDIHVHRPRMQLRSKCATNTIVDVHGNNLKDYNLQLP